MHANKSEWLSKTSDFYAFKNACAILMKKNRDIGTTDFLCILLLDDRDEKDEPHLIKFIETVALLLVELDTAKWRNHLIEENYK